MWEWRLFRAGRLGSQHLQIPVCLQVQGFKRWATTSSAEVTGVQRRVNLPLRSAERIGSSAKPVKASTAAFISCTSFSPFGNVAELPGCPFLVSKDSIASMGVVDPLAREDSAW